MNPVTNILVRPENDSTVNISWTPPSTLEGVPIDGYSITITNNTSGRNETVSVKSNYLLHHIGQNDFGNFTILVIPVNSAGDGGASIYTGPLRQTDMFTSSSAISSKYENNTVCLVCCKLILFVL